MKKLSVVLVAVLSLCLIASLAFAGAKMGTVKSVDAAKGSIVITCDGKDEALKAGHGVDLSKVKAGDKVEFAADKDTVTSLKAAAAAKPKAAVGC
ncbi:MAG: copper-binding protein [Nitrospiraceae bacterium]|nr:copper-binding protein [Nitrospiraceae bacterium]